MDCGFNFFFHVLNLLVDKILGLFDDLILQEINEESWDQVFLGKMVREINVNVSLMNFFQLCGVLIIVEFDPS